MKHHYSLGNILKDRDLTDKRTFDSWGKKNKFIKEDQGPEQNNIAHCSKIKGGILSNIIQPSAPIALT